MSSYHEEALVFRCGDDRMTGIVHLPTPPYRLGVVIVVGGPQYRVGSHRQFVLLARYLAEHGVAVFRFDCRGMGDSDGGLRNFEQINQDIKSAIDAFMAHAPSVDRIMLWGLCDAASAASFYAHEDSRVDRLLLLNPWVRTEAGQAKAYLRHYYIYRLMTKDFWKKLISGAFEYSVSFRSLFELLKRSFGRDQDVELKNRVRSSQHLSLPERMRLGLINFKGGVRIVLSGNDLTAAEFGDLAKTKAWRDALKSKQIELRVLDGSNHTFSRKIWRDQVALWTLEWAKS